MISPLKALVKNLLANASAKQRWTLQGFGMLRLHINDGEEEVRLHVWDERFRTPGVTRIHTHPWDFTSTVVAGCVRNDLYQEVSPASPLSRPYQQAMIKCGIGTHVEPIREVHLAHISSAEICAGMTYSQKSAEVHDSIPVAGSVTIVQRLFHEDRDHALVYWPLGEEFVSAQPRLATDHEIYETTQLALHKWFR